MLIGGFEIHVGRSRNSGSRCADRRMRNAGVDPDVERVVAARRAGGQAEFLRTTASSFSNQRFVPCFATRSATFRTQSRIENRFAFRR